MSKTLNIPEFENEAEEAAWWDSHPDETLGVFEQAAKAGVLAHGTLARSVSTATSIRLDSTDIQLAKDQAQQRGLRYQTYLKMIIHQHLQQEATSVSALKPSTSNHGGTT